MPIRGILYYSALPGGTEAERESALGYQLALAAIAALLGEEADPSRLEFPARGKPRYAGGPDFSISHSLGAVACAAVSEGTVGLDLERDPQADRLTLYTVCDDWERALASRIGTRGVWVAKEAALKAGGGTIEQLALVRLTQEGAVFGERRYYRQTPALPWPAACLMTSVPGVPFEVREWPVSVSRSVV